MKFIVDENVGKLTRRLRMLGYDTVFFRGDRDGDMIAIALAEDRVILTRDTHVLEWGLVKKGAVRAVLVESDDPELQTLQVIRGFHLSLSANLFSRCLECNLPLHSIDKEAVAGRVPAYVFKTQERFLECPGCHRTYWRGTHWQSMMLRLSRLSRDLGS
jgi:uncharacterized protein